MNPMTRNQKTDRTVRRRNRQSFPILPLIGVLVLAVICCAVILKKSRPKWELTVNETSDAKGRTYHSYDWRNLKHDGDRLTYEDEHYTSAQGIDVSSHQDEIDWQAVSEDGIEFVFLRVGYRGYTEGGLFEDQYFRTNLIGARQAGLKIGVYFFSQAVSAEEAVEEAEFMLEILGDSRLDLPVVFDMEEPENGDTGRTEILSREEQTASALAFMERTAEAGYSVMIYDSSARYEDDYDLTALQGIKKWTARYGDTPDFPYAFEIWQYTDNGSVEGIEGGTDMNIMFLPKD